MSKEKRTQKIKPTSLIFVLVGFLALVQLVITHNLANTGEKLRELEEGFSQVEKEKIVLTESINSAGSLTAITKKAENLGLMKATQVLHVVPQIPVALDTSEVF